MSFSIPTLRGFINKINQSGGGFNYTEFCNLYDPAVITGLTISSSTFGILPDGASFYTTANLSDTLTFSLTVSLQQYLIDNTHARLRYSYQRNCNYGSQFPATVSNIDITDGLTLQIDNNTDCADRGTDFIIDIVFDTDDSSPLYEDVCNGIVVDAPDSIGYQYTIGLNQ